MPNNCPSCLAACLLRFAASEMPHGAVDAKLLLRQAAEELK